MQTLQKIQCELKAPKNLKNNFGGFNYRNVENILEAVKPLLKKHEAILTISDDILQVGDRFYIKATATITDKDAKSISVSALARESLTKKGMDDAQITGSASSYARKYALGGLFLLDDNKDIDSEDNTKIDYEADKVECKKLASQVLNTLLQIGLKGEDITEFMSANGYKSTDLETMRRLISNKQKMIDDAQAFMNIALSQRGE